jgi:hypothetical protein
MVQVCHIGQVAVGHAWGGPTLLLLRDLKTTYLCRALLVV